MQEWPQPFPGDTERDHGPAVRVDDGCDIRTGLVDRTMDEPFEVWLARIAVQDLAIEADLHDVVRRHKLG